MTSLVNVCTQTDLLTGITKPKKCQFLSNIKKNSESESTHQGEHKCVVPELLLTDDLYKNAGKGGHLNCAASGGLFLYSGRGQWI